MQLVTWRLQERLAVRLLPKVQASAQTTKLGQAIRLCRLIPAPLHMMGKLHRRWWEDDCGMAGHAAHVKGLFDHQHIERVAEATSAFVASMEFTNSDAAPPG
jgi:hypothetical protein